jgi:transposase InsO family protein
MGFDLRIGYFDNCRAARGSRITAIVAPGACHRWPGPAHQWSRPCTPTDNPKAESFMKTLKYEEIYALDYETLNDIKNRLPRFLDEVYNRRRIHSALNYLTPEEFELQSASVAVN